MGRAARESDRPNAGASRALHPRVWRSNVSRMAVHANEPEPGANRRICCLGSINADVTVRLDRLPDRHEKISARETRVGGGGSAANTAVWLSRQGLSVSMLGWVGDDPLGQLALSDLRANGVDTCGVKVLPVASPIAVCLSPPDDNRIIVSPVIAAPWSPFDVVDLFADADWLHTTICEAAFLRRREKRARRAASCSLSGVERPLRSRIREPRGLPFYEFRRAGPKAEDGRSRRLHQGDARG